MGVKVFEKHFTLSNKLKGIDQKASLNTKDFENYIKAIKQGYQSIGVSKKAPSVAEKGINFFKKKFSKQRYKDWRKIKSQNGKFKKEMEYLRNF